MPIENPYRSVAHVSRDLLDWQSRVAKQWERSIQTRFTQVRDKAPASVFPQKAIEMPPGHPGGRSRILKREQRVRILLPNKT
jgi:hypothetical protein